MKVDLIYFNGCPNIAAVRKTLTQALLKSQHPIQWTEWDQNDENCPKDYMRYGSPTVLIEGIDVAPTKIKPQGSCCRIYTNNKKPSGSPDLELVIAAISPQSLHHKKGQ